MVLLLCEATGGSSTMSEGHGTFLLRGRRRHGRIHVAGTASMPLEPMHHDLSKPSPHVEAAQTHISSQALISSSRHMSAIGGRGCTAVGLQPFEPIFFSISGISLEKAITSNNTPQVKDAEQGQRAPRARYDMALLVKPRVRKLS